MNILAGGVSSFAAWLTLHQHVAYIVLFCGSYFETLVGPSFVIPGELFLIMGSVLAGAGVLNIWLVALVLYVGGILGDTSSYWIGRRVGEGIFKEGRWIFNPRNYKRGEDFFKAHGPKAIFLARLLGPVSWITPFLAGTYAIPYRTFLKYNLPGIFVGIGEFLVVGYFFGNQYQRILSQVGYFVFAIIAAVIFFFIIRWLVKKNAS